MANENESDESAAPPPVAFISHHSSEHKAALRLKTVLAQNGIVGWIAPDDIEPGQPFDEAIIEGIAAADVIILLFSEKSDRSRHVKRELIMADNQQKLVYPIRLEDTPSKGLAYWLNDYQWIDWFDGREATLQRAIDSIRKQILGEGNDSAASAAAIRKAINEQAAARQSRLRDETGRFRPQVHWVAAFLIMFVGAGLYAFYSISSDEAETTLAADEPEYEVRPGQWDTRYEVIRILRSDNPDPAALDVWAEEFGGEIRSQCITPSQARAPGNDFFDPNRERNCTLNDLEMTGGRLSVTLDCEPDDLEGNQLVIAIDGSYSLEEMTSDAEFTYGGGTDREFRFLVRQTSRYVGPCAIE